MEEEIEKQRVGKMAGMPIVPDLRHLRDDWLYWQYDQSMAVKLFGPDYFLYLIGSQSSWNIAWYPFFNSTLEPALPVFDLPLCHVTALESGVFDAIPAVIVGVDSVAKVKYVAEIAAQDDPYLKAAAKATLKALMADADAAIAAAAREEYEKLQPEESAQGALILLDVTIKPGNGETVVLSEKAELFAPVPLPGGREEKDYGPAALGAAVVGLKRKKRDPNGGLDLTDEERNLKIDGSIKLKNIKMRVIKKRKEIFAISRKYGDGRHDATTPFTPRSFGAPTIQGKFKWNLSEGRWKGRGLSFNDRLAGAQVMVIGPGNGGEVMAFVSTFPDIEAIHVVDVDESAFLILESLLEELRKAGKKVPKIYGYLTTVLELPAELKGKADVIFVRQLFEEASFDFEQSAQGGQEMVDALKPGGMIISEMNDGHPLYPLDGKPMEDAGGGVEGFLDFHIKKPAVKAVRGGLDLTAKNFEIKTSGGDDDIVGAALRGRPGQAQGPAPTVNGNVENYGYLTFDVTVMKGVTSNEVMRTLAAEK